MARGRHLGHFGGVPVASNIADDGRILEDRKSRLATADGIADTAK
jgi:hypothetical protein